MDLQIRAVNLGHAERLDHNGRSRVTGIGKRPAPGPVAIARLGVAGDRVVNTKHHGGPDQAVYVYGEADYAYWAGVLGRAPEPGTFGENLTVTGLESADFAVGDRLAAGTVVLEVTAPRIPCATLAARMGDAGFVKAFMAGERPGLYCRVLAEGVVAAGDAVTVTRCTGERVTMLALFRGYAQPADADELRRRLAAPLAARVRTHLEQQLAKAERG